MKNDVDLTNEWMISGNFSYSISKSCSGCRDVITIPIEKGKITAVLIQEEDGGVIYMIWSLEHILVFNGDTTKEGSTLDSSTSL